MKTLGRRTKSTTLFGTVMAMLAGFVPLLATTTPSSAQAAPPVAPSAAIKLSVAAARDQDVGTGPHAQPVGIHKGDAITSYKWLINADPSGDAKFDGAACFPTRAAEASKGITGDPKYPANCQNPSIHKVTGDAPVVTSGDENDLNAGTGITLPNGKYLISVMSGGFKIDGAHFTVNGADQNIGVTMNPVPLKTLTVRVNVFNDNASTNGQWDQDAESYVPGGFGQPAINDMSGFTVHLADVLAQVTTDVYGNPLCTVYKTDGNGNVILNGDGLPTPQDTTDKSATGGQLQGSPTKCVTGPDGQLAIPNMGPNRYAVTVVPPDPQTIGGKQWIKTTTLEGGHDWDSWNQEGGTGYDTELVVGGERVPPIDAGFVLIDPKKANAENRDPGLPVGTGDIKGNVSVGRTYIPPIGNANYGYNNAFGGTRLDGPITDGIVAVSCLAGCGSLPTDQTVSTLRADAQGNFDVRNLPAGSYSVAIWDEKQNYILFTQQVEVQEHKTSDMGTVPLNGWFADLKGTVFVDTNGNGRRDPGEVGVPDFLVAVKGRSNYTYDQGATGSVTNDKGEYSLDQIYPLTQWLVIEFFNTRFKTTGVTWQADNQPNETTKKTGQVDLDFLPIIGLSSRLDIGVQPYGPGENGGIVGTVTYDTTRNETNTKNSAAESYQPSIPGLTTQLWGSKADGNGGFVKYPDGSGAASGAYVQVCRDGSDRPASAYGTEAAAGDACQPLNTYVTEHWNRPTSCTTYNVDKQPFQSLALPDNQAANGDNPYHDQPMRDDAGNVILDANGRVKYPECVEAPQQSIQFGGDGTVDGNYGFATYFDAAGSEKPLESGTDYLVEVVNPLDPIVPTKNGAPHHLYSVTDEASINVFSGDSYAPQDGWASDGSAAGGTAPHVQVVPGGDPLDNKSNAGTVAQCAGALHTVDDSANTDFTGAVGGSIFNGLTTPTCEQKLVKVQAERSVAPTFFMYTEVPTPAHFYGLIINDLGISSDPRAVVYGEAEPVPYVPIGVYDQYGVEKWVTNADYNGFYEMIVPSTSTYNCPLPAGPCPNVYRLIGNDPGQPLNTGFDHSAYNPAYRTIGTEFQAWPGVVHPVDQAVTPNGATIEQPGSKVQQQPQCAQPSTQPVIYRVNDPVIGEPGDPSRALVITGRNFSAATTVTLGGTALSPVTFAQTNPMTNTGTLTVNVPANFTTGALNLVVANGAAEVQTSVNTATVHVIGGSYTPHVIKVTDGSALPTVNITGITSANQPGVGRVATFTFSSNPGLHAAGNSPFGGDHFIVTGASNPNFNGTWAVNSVLSGNRVTVLLAANPGANAGAASAKVENGSVYSSAADIFVGGEPDGSFRAIQRALEQAHRDAASNPSINPLVVVYPNTDPRYAPFNPSQAYFENIVIHSKVKVQGVGAGHVADASDPVAVPGTTIDGSSFWAAPAGVFQGQVFVPQDGTYATNWQTAVAALPRAETDPQSPDGEVVMVIAESQNQYLQGSFRSAIDGFSLTGGNQQGFPNNINNIGGAGNGQVVTPSEAQGSGIFLTAFVQGYTIGNNVIRQNGGAYGGGIRVGSPHIGTAANGVSMENTGLKILNNRVLFNGGSNLAGGIALFNGTRGYEVANNDICGNYSTEYGGGISHYGYSAQLGNVRDSIHDNRIVFNQAYDEGGGVMIAGELPGVNSTLTQGAGPVDIYDNIIQANLSNDDGGGIRFLMAGGSNNPTFNVYNNIIANNISTHEGGGAAIDDTPNVNFYNNTVVKNLTTATAMTSNGLPAPAGLSTGANSALLQRSLPAGSWPFSKPVLFNNIFADNRAGTWTINGITGIGLNGATDIKLWDVGSVDGVNTLTVTNSIMNSGTGFAPSPTNFIGGANLLTQVSFVSTYDTSVDVSALRTNPQFKQALIVAVDAPLGAMGDYHLSQSPVGNAVNAGAVSTTGCSVITPPGCPANRVINVSAPTTDIDHGVRPVGGGFDAGADELPPPSADLSITKTDGLTTVTPGQAVTYTIVASNAGPTAVTGATVTDSVPALLTGVTVSCVASSGSSCTSTSSGGTASLLVGGTATYTIRGTVSAVPGSGTLANTASITAAITDPNPGNNTALDTDTVNVPKPTVGLLDNFNRANANTLGGNWSQSVVLGSAGVRVNGNQAFCGSVLQCLVPASALWNVPAAGFGAKQAAAFTFAGSSLDSSALMLKASGNNFVRVRYETTGTGQVVVGTTTNAGLSFTTRGTFLGVSFASGDTLTAMVDAAGVTWVWKTSGATSTFVGAVQIPTSGAGSAPFVTGTGRIGLLLPNNGRADDFSGGTIP